jgi:hypothetical protein
MRIELSVGLGARAAYSRAFSTIEDTELDPAEIGDSGHQTIQSVDFPDQMAFSKPANSGVTGHGANSAKPVCYEDCFCAHTGRRGRSFTTGVAAADHRDVESMGHKNLGRRLLARRGEGSKSSDLKKRFT